jgi:hypothetical protein
VTAVSNNARLADILHGRSGRQFLKDPALGFNREQQCSEPSDERDRCERREHVPDTKVADDPADQYRTDRRSRPEPRTAEAGADRAQTRRIELGRVEIERERDGLQNRIGGGRQDQHFGGRAAFADYGCYALDGALAGADIGVDESMSPQLGTSRLIQSDCRV